MLRLSCLALALALVGCGAPDPCKDVKGTCVSARVEGNVKNLDQLEVRAMTLVHRTPEPPRSFELPVLVALVPPAGLTGDVDVTVAGLRAGNEVAASTRTVSFTAGRTTSVVFVLDGAGGGDMSLDDLSDPLDFTGCTPIDPCTATAFGMQSDTCGGMVDCGGPSVTAVTPRYARAGERIVIHGRFPGAPTNVLFPGGAAGIVDAGDATRILTTMPPAATAGPITISFTGASVTTAAVRRIGFALGQQPFFTNYEQTNGARVAQGMTTARAYHGVVADREHVYVFGGRDGVGALNTVERALVNADGTLFRFVVEPQTMTTARSRAATVRIKDRVYVIGGEDGGAPFDTIDATTINADHSVAAFAELPGRLTVGRAGASAVVIGNYLYVIGGNGLRSVERAVIGADGSLGPFVNTGVQLSVPRWGAAAVVAGRYLYVLGGVDGSGHTASIDRATITFDGDLTTTVAGTFDVHNTTLPGQSAFHAVTLVGQKLYLTGGYDGTVKLATSASADLTLDGDLGAFTAGSPLTAPNVGGAAFVVGNRLYVLGGDTLTIQSGFEWASLMASGTTIGAPSVIGATVPTTRINYCMAVLGRHIYLFGGRYAGDIVEHATVSEDGSVSGFTDLNKNLAAGQHEGCTAAVIGRWVYVAGGYFAAVDNDTVQRLPINDDGTLGTYDAVGASGSWPLGRAWGASAVTKISWFNFGGQYYETGMLKNYDGYSYAYAQFTDGAIGGINLQTPAVGTQLYDMRAAVFGQRISLVGGTVAASAYADVSAAAGTITGTGAGPTLNSVRQQPALAYVGARLYVIGGYPAANQNSYETIPVNSDGSLGTATQSAGGYFGAAGFSNFHGAIIDNNLFLFSGVEGNGVGSGKVLRIPIQ